MLGFIFVCYDNKVLWCAHAGKQDPISLLLTKPCVFSAKEIGHRHCTKPLLHILLSWFVNTVSIASIFIWGFHLLFPYYKHSSAPVVRAASCRDSAESSFKADLHSTGFAMFAACRMSVGVATDSGWEWGWLGGHLRRARLPLLPEAGPALGADRALPGKSWVWRLQGLPGSLLPLHLPRGDPFPAMLPGFQPGGSSPFPVTLKTKSDSSHRVFLGLREWRSDIRFLKILFKSQHWIFCFPGYFRSGNGYLHWGCINISGCVTFTSAQTFGSVRCLEGWDSTSRQGLLSGEQEGGENPVQVSLMPCTSSLCLLQEECLY